jgi:hypothetical protein
MVWEAGDKKMGLDSVITDDKKIYDLTEVYEEKNGRNGQEVIVVDGRGYERMPKNNNDIHPQSAVIEDSLATKNMNDEIIRRATEIAERVAREIIPEVAERVIREEIEKLKKLSDNESSKVS